MAYPRRCPLCDRSYGDPGAHITGQVTVRSEPGGTPSPAFLHLPGRLLALRCLDCGGEYPWDFFAHAGHLPREVRVHRAGLAALVGGGVQVNSNTIGIPAT